MISDSALVVLYSCRSCHYTCNGPMKTRRLPRLGFTLLPPVRRPFVNVWRLQRAATRMARRQSHLPSIGIHSTMVCSLAETIRLQWTTKFSFSEDMIEGLILNFLSMGYEVFFQRRGNRGLCSKLLVNREKFSFSEDVIEAITLNCLSNQSKLFFQRKHDRRPNSKLIVDKKNLEFGFLE